MKQIIIISLLLMFYGCCQNHECCDHTKRERERSEYIQGLSPERLERYEKCLKDHYVEAKIKCYSSYLSDAITERCTQDVLHNACME